MNRWVRCSKCDEERKVDRFSKEKPEAHKTSPHLEKMNGNAVG
jgi:hypothetical protein